MGRCIRLSIIVCLFLTLNLSAKTIISGIQTAEELIILLDEASTRTYILKPIDWSTPTVNDTGDGISGMGPYYRLEPEEAWVAFDLSSIPDDAQIVSASLSAYMTSYGIQAQRTLWYYPDDSWAINADIQLSDPGDYVQPNPNTLVGTIVHNESQYTWKTINITHNWTNDLADNYVTFMLTGPQNGAIIYGVIGLAVNTAFNIDKVPELTLTISGDPLPITVTSPNGGESWQTGTSHTITWNKSETTGANVKIELYKDDSYLSDIIVSTANDGSYTWPVPSNLPAGTTYKIKITDTGNSSTYDYSDNYFNITSLIPSSGSVQFASSTYSVTENSGTIRIYVSRTGGSYGAASVNYFTDNGTASQDSDYSAKSGTLNWANGDTADKYFDISITNDSIYESDETFAVSLMNAIGASQGSPDQATVIITDDDSLTNIINPPEVDTLSVIEVASGTAILVGLLENDGCEEIEENCLCRFLYWIDGEKGNAKSTDWQSGVRQGQNYSIEISGLDPNALYYFYAQAKNSAGMVKGRLLSFKTYSDPNTPPAAFDPNEPDTLLIQNFVKLFFADPNKPHYNQGLVAYVEGIGLNEIDPNDVLYSVPAYAMESKIVSLISSPVKKGQMPVFYELSKDARPDNAQDALLELSIFSPEPNDPNISSENSLKFWLAKDAFEDKTVTIQQVSSDVNVIYPVWDVNQIISKNGRRMPLSDLTSQKLNAPYAYFTISTSRQILDMNGDGIVDLADYALLSADEGKTGIYRSDIACTKGTVTVVGIPDGKVNEIDVIAFILEYNKKNPANPIPNPYAGISEDFESGQILEPFFTSGSSSWVIDTDSHNGQFCVKSGDIGNNRNSLLKVNIKCVTGQINFYRKVSSESYDELIFYIDGAEIEKWSGELNWKQMSYLVAPGTHTLRWEYKKDWSLSDGEDAAWIDDIVAQ